MPHETRTIKAFFEEDHRKIDALLAAIRFAARADAARFAEFDRHLERHIVWEEGLLFPAVGAREPGLEWGPLAVMKAEHSGIRAGKAGALAALRAGRFTEARAAVQGLAAVLEPHNMKEERILYPLCDGLLAGAEAAAVLAKVRAANMR